MKIEIKERRSGKILWGGEASDLKVALELAVKERADLTYANLEGAKLVAANLDRADLLGANLEGANLAGACLTGACLIVVNLMRANLSGATLVRADLTQACMAGANLVGANFAGAELVGTNFAGADLTRANLVRANLVRANLLMAKNAETAVAMTRILPEGDIIGWKKCRDGVLVKLLIPMTSRRSHAYGRKCRAERAKVLDVIGADFGESTCDAYSPLKYKKGEWVSAHEWGDDSTQECAGGIHFFISRLEAENHAPVLG